LQNNSKNAALLVGNGVNLAGGANAGGDWTSLLGSLADRHIPNYAEIPSGVSMTEFYDILDLTSNSIRPLKLQKEFCNLMEDWKPSECHRSIGEWALRNEASLLTTNFDDLFSQSLDLELFSALEESPKRAKGTDYYPWQKYYAQNMLLKPDTGFGVWHPNGMRKHFRSIRLGLSHYMGSVERTRGWIYKGKQTRLLADSDSLAVWQGRQTWLQIIFNRPLIIFGLSLSECEVFLRWLLIERARFYRKFPKHKQEAWYVFPKTERENIGKHFFLRSVGVEPFEVSGHDEIYDRATWA